MKTSPRHRMLPLSVIIIVACINVPNLSFAGTAPLPDSSLTATLDTLSGDPLSLEQAIQHALTNSTDVRQAEARYLAARGVVRRERGAFDPELFFNANYLDKDQPTSSVFSGASTLATKTTTTQSGVRISLPTGTDFELSLNTTKLETNSNFAFLNPEYDATGGLSVRQSLLRGFTASARKNLGQAKRQRDAAEARYNQAILSTTATVERAYWDLYAATRDYAVQILTVERGKALRRETDFRAQAGLVGPNQVASARTFLAQTNLLMIDLAERLDAQSDALAELIGVRPQNGNARFIAISEPSASFSTAPVDSLVSLAQRNNLNMQAAQKDIEAAQVIARAAGWELLPSVDLVGAVGGSGLSGTPQEVIFGGDTLTVDRGGTFGDAISQVSSRDFPDWSVGIQVTIPIGFRHGAGERDRLNADLMSARTYRTALSRLLETQVRSAYRELSHGQDRLAAAGEGVDAAQEQVRTGLIEFHNGRSTAFDLVLLTADLALAEQRYSDALARTAKAAATLRELVSDSSAVITNP